MINILIRHIDKSCLPYASKGRRAIEAFGPHRHCLRQSSTSISQRVPIFRTGSQPVACLGQPVAGHTALPCPAQWVVVTYQTGEIVLERVQNRVLHHRASVAAVVHRFHMMPVLEKEEPAVALAAAVVVVLDS